MKRRRLNVILQVLVIRGPFNFLHRTVCLHFFYVQSSGVGLILHVLVGWLPVFGKLDGLGTYWSIFSPAVSYIGFMPGGVRGVLHMSAIACATSDCVPLRSSSPHILFLKGVNAERRPSSWQTGSIVTAILGSKDRSSGGARVLAAVPPVLLQQEAVAATLDHVGHGGPRAAARFTA